MSSGAVQTQPAGMIWALRLEYDGRPFVGWQRQANGLSVQEVLEQAAARLCRGVVPPVHVAGRTDAGVHAAGQVVDIKLPDTLSAHSVRSALNFHMQPHPVSVLEAAPVPWEGWNARFSAKARVYRYVILNRPARPALEHGFVWHVPRPLDAGAMQRAGRSLLGRHDFTSFRAAACQANSPLRTLDRLDIEHVDDHILVTVAARSFLHHQVRNIVGTLKLVGDGSWPETRVAVALAARNRAAAGPTAPADGLTFMEVRYDEDPFRSASRQSEDTAAEAAHPDSSVARRDRFPLEADTRLFSTTSKGDRDR